MSRLLVHHHFGNRRDTGKNKSVNIVFNDGYVIIKI